MPFDTSLAQHCTRLLNRDTAMTHHHGARQADPGLEITEVRRDHAV
ncbi:MULTISPECIES: hypothetical protein [Halomonas]|uniref:Uncharacterized protein n=1 Tax=Halomonas flagellata TaxID=2920385 RepID=A0ABS9RQM5_9GAMM|nr:MULTISPECIES: hypothetical protein [Halomonas]MCH4562148.1 hypothetical protein [Halomonas flagellata]